MEAIKKKFKELNDKNMSKKYCKNCKYYRKEFRGIIVPIYMSEYCTKLGIEMTQDGNILDTINEIRELGGGKPILSIKEQNKNNDCNMYKKKWWLFFK